MKFEEFVNMINKTETEKIFECINNFEINLKNKDEWINDLFELVYEIDINKMPYVLDSLYRTDDKFKFMTFCMLLEATYRDLPYITPLENIRIFKAKYEILIHTLVEVFVNSHNGIGDCMGCIVLNNDPKGTLFTEEEYEEFVNGLNKKLELVKEYIKGNLEIQQEVYSSLEVLLDLTTYIHNEKTFEILRQYKDLAMNNRSKVYLIKSVLVNKLMDINSKWWEEISNDLDAYYSLARVLTSITSTNSIPKEYINIEKLARASMVDWLKYPTELGKEPEYIENVGTIERENIIFYIYKFTSNKFKDKGEMLGVSGGFIKDRFTTSEMGFTFSNFDTITDEYIKQAEDIINMISERWKSRVNNN